MKLFSLYMVIILLSNNEVVADSPTNTIYSINDRVSSCSGWLATIIYNFCNNHYKIVKRDTSLMIEKMAPKSLHHNMNKRRLLVEGNYWRRVRRQVANECCLRPCTVADIIMYCPDDAKLLQENPGIFD